MRLPISHVTLSDERDMLGYKQLIKNVFTEEDVEVRVANSLYYWKWPTCANIWCRVKNKVEFFSLFLNQDPSK